MDARIELVPVLLQAEGFPVTKVYRDVDGEVAIDWKITGYAQRDEAWLRVAHRVLVSVGESDEDIPFEEWRDR